MLQEKTYSNNIHKKCDYIQKVKFWIFMTSERGDMLSVDGDADAAVEARIWIGWNKFRQLVPCLLYTSDAADE